MADKKEKRTMLDIINENQVKKGSSMLGEFPESTGGGTPMQKGEKIDFIAHSQEEADAYREQHPEAIIRQDQARDPKTGRFAHAQVNFRDRKYPDRAKTLPDFVLNLNIAFAKKSGKAYLIDIEGHKFELPENIKTAQDFIDYVIDNVNDSDELEKGLKAKGGRTPKQVYTIGIGYQDFVAVEAEVAAEIKQVVRNKKLKPKYVSRTKTEQPKTTKTPVTPPAKAEQPTTPKAPEQQKPETGNKDGVDYSVAKSDPETFVKNNREQIQNLVKLADEKGVDISVDGMVEAIASGEVKSFDDIKKVLEGIE
jgi:hypothetical protein